MSLFFPMEFETSVSGKNGFIFIEQTNKDGIISVIVLTVHQFSEIFNREKHIIDEAYKNDGVL